MNLEGFLPMVGETQFLVPEKIGREKRGSGMQILVSFALFEKMESDNVSKQKRQCFVKDFSQKRKRCFFAFLGREFPFQNLPKF